MPDHVGDRGAVRLDPGAYDHLHINQLGTPVAVLSVSSYSRKYSNRDAQPLACTTVDSVSELARSSGRRARRWFASRGSLTTERNHQRGNGVVVSRRGSGGRGTCVRKPRLQMQKATNSIHNELPYLKPFLAEVLRRSYRAAPAGPVSHLPWPL
jgi:hypothetical protein